MADASSSRRERRVQQREQRDEMIKKERAQYKARQRNKRIINYTVGALILIAIGYAIFLATRGSGPGQYDAFAKCLTKQGVVMYGTDWCPHCQEQKRLFGTSFQYVDYVNCDLNKDACDLAGVQGFPTWAFAAGPKGEGVQPLESLSERTQCPLG